MTGRTKGWSWKHGCFCGKIIRVYLFLSEAIIEEADVELDHGLGKDGKPFNS